ncbi:MAG TPA: hypothetical protein ENJ32_05260 [Crenotrichaceae bacterium]|nr:hypothetical protein [Crenotrichaceae bacterium]
MSNVFITIDIGIAYVSGDNALEFSEMFQRMIYGTTRQGDCGLPLVSKILCDNGLTGSFFIESLFALNKGIQPLQEIVVPISNAQHEVQLQIDARTANWYSERLFGEELPRTSFSDCTLKQQTRLIKAARELLLCAGIRDVNAFRTNSSEINLDTLKALSANGIFIDSSVYEVSSSNGSDIFPDEKILQPGMLNDVFSYPVTVFKESEHQFRYLRLAVCSYRELESVLLHALENEWESVVIGMQSYDLMTAGQARLDKIALRRFNRLCQLLADNSDVYQVRGFSGFKPTHVVIQQPELYISGQLNRFLRGGEQAIRRVI